MALSAFKQSVIDNVREHGWHCNSVLPRADDPNPEPNFSYSVGWWESLKSSETIIFGLPHELQHSMLWSLFEQIKSGLILSDGLKISGLIDGFDCVAKPVLTSQIGTHLTSAQWYYKYMQNDPDMLTAYQLVWPSSASGLFPWDECCDPELLEMQPSLYGTM